MGNEQNKSQTLPHSPGRVLVQGAIFGIIFGFLLQKGGVAKYDVLMGQLLLQDWTVAIVIFSAIVIGATGIYLMSKLGLVELNLKPTRYAANLVGGLIFGAGFAISGYCPGTGAAALGQGNFDALAVVVGMVIGSYLYAEVSGYLDRTIESVGKRGELTLDKALHIPKAALIATLWVILAGAFLLTRSG